MALGVLINVSLPGNGLGDLMPGDRASPGPGDGPGRGVVYLVELGSRPNYRLVEHDLATGNSTPIFVVPETGVIWSVARSSDHRALVLAYTSDYTVPGTGLYVLDLGQARRLGPGGDELLEPLLAEQPSGLFQGVDVGPDGTTVWASLDEEGAMSVVGVDVATGDVVHRIDSAVEPAAGPGWVAYLIVEPDQSRRSIGLLDLATGSTSTIDVLDGRYDLGNLLASEVDDRLLLTAFVPRDEPIIQLGEPAGAHGDHDGPAQWLAVDLGNGEIELLVNHEPMPVRSAVLLENGEVAEITDAGLVIVGEPPETIVESYLLAELG